MKRFALALLFLCFSTVLASATNLFAVCATTCTWNGVSTLMWSTSSGGATGAGPPTSADTVTFDAATCVGGTTCTTTVNTNPTIISLTFGACTASTTGCILDFSVNNNNITITSPNGYIGNGSGVRTLKMGNGTWTFTGATTGNVWRTDTLSNFTLTPGGSTIFISNSNNSGEGFLNSLSTTFNKIKVSGSINFSTTVLNVATFEVVGISTVWFQAANTFNITTTLTTTTSASSPASFSTNSIGARATITVPSSSTMSWTGLRDIDFTGSGSTPTCTNCSDYGHNLNVTITAPGAGGGGGGCITSGWLLWRDMPEHINDNFPAWIEKAA